MNDDNNQNNEQNQENAQQGMTTQPEENGGSERVFTQEEVNQIVRERLARDRAGRENAQQQEAEAAARSADLAQREAKLSCREFIVENGYKTELLEILPTNNADAFKSAVSKLVEIAPSLDPNARIPYFSASTVGNVTPTSEDLIAAAFRPKRR